MLLEEKLAKAAVNVLHEGGCQARTKTNAQAFLAHEVTALEFMETLELLPAADYREVRHAAEGETAAYGKH